MVFVRCPYVFIFVFCFIFVYGFLYVAWYIRRFVLKMKLLLRTSVKKHKKNIKTVILSSKVKNFLSRGRAEGQNPIFLASQPASQPATGPKIHDSGPLPFPETRNPSLLKTVSQFLYFFYVFWQMSLAKASFWQKTKVLLRTSVKKHKKNIKTLILSSKVKNFLSRGRAEGQNLIFWIAGWLAGAS